MCSPNSDPKRCNRISSTPSPSRKNLTKFQLHIYASAQIEVSKFQINGKHIVHRTRSTAFRMTSQQTSNIPSVTSAPPLGSGIALGISGLLALSQPSISATFDAAVFWTPVPTLKLATFQYLLWYHTKMNGPRQASDIYKFTLGLCIFHKYIYAIRVTTMTISASLNIDRRQRGKLT